jgi:hypothetical protein
MQSQDTISNTNTGIATRADLQAERGRKMFLQRQAGFSDQDIAIRFGVDPEDVDGLIRVAEDNLVMSEIEEEARVANLQESYEINQKMKDLYNETPTIATHRKQGIGNVKVGDRSRPVVMNLEETWSNAAVKSKILEARTRLLSERNRLLGARKSGGPDGSEDKAAMVQILETIKDVTREVMSEAGVIVGDAHERTIEEAREVGRLQERTAGSVLMIPAAAVIDVETDPEGGSSE